MEKGRDGDAGFRILYVRRGGGLEGKEGFCWDAFIE